MKITLAKELYDGEGPIKDTEGHNGRGLCRSGMLTVLDREGQVGVASGGVFGGAWSRIDVTGRVPGCLEASVNHYSHTVTVHVLPPYAPGSP